MKYEKMTKAQLIEKIGELETQTVQYKWEAFTVEAMLLLEDLQKLSRVVFGLGVAAKAKFHSVDWKALKEQYLPQELPQEHQPQLTNPQI
jgi:hypothetical protein